MADVVLYKGEPLRLILLFGRPCLRATASGQTDIRK